MDKVKVVGAKVKDGKPQHLTIGKVYEVDAKTAELMLKNGQAKAYKPEK